jgi:hypothetical protein
LARAKRDKPEKTNKPDKTAKADKPDKTYRPKLVRRLEKAVKRAREAAARLEEATVELEAALADVRPMGNPPKGPEEDTSKPLEAVPFGTLQMPREGA